VSEKTTAQELSAEGHAPRGPSPLGSELLVGKNAQSNDTKTGMGTQLASDRERADVISWRRRQLVTSGFPRSLASRVAEARDFDLHALIELVERGCPPHLAARILAPLDGTGVDA
jgi:hypothetical protein